jgi:hypothetical protein
MEHKFKSSFTRFGDPTAPERIDIDDEKVTYKNNRGIRTLYLATDTTSIKRSEVISVDIIDQIWGVHVSINTRGYARIYVKNFTMKDAKQIEKILIG